MNAHVLTSSALFALTLGACSWSGQTVEDTNDAPIPSGTKDSCGDASPVVQLVHIEDGGVRATPGRWAGDRYALEPGAAVGI